MILRFLNGPHKGKEVTLKKGLILSRKSTKKDVLSIEDSKASNPHAQVIKKKNGLYLQDMDSKNGTYFKGEINDSFALLPGIQFTIGKTVMEVTEPPPPPKIWSEEVIIELKNLSIKDREQQIQIIKPALILKFKSGVQKGNTWYIGYGPRTAGAASLDLPILEPQAPDVCFSLEPLKESVLFKTQYPEKVLINKEHISTKELIDKDCISFASTFIEISYDKESSK